MDNLKWIKLVTLFFYHSKPRKSFNCLIIPSLTLGSLWLLILSPLTLHVISYIEYVWLLYLTIFFSFFATLLDGLLQDTLTWNFFLNSVKLFLKIVVNTNRFETKLSVSFNSYRVLTHPIFHIKEWNLNFTLFMLRYFILWQF